MTFWPKKFYLSLFDKKWLFWTKGNSEFLLNLKITGRVYAEVFCINSINLILFNCMKLYEIVAELRVSKGYPLTPLTLFILGGGGQTKAKSVQLFWNNSTFSKIIQNSIQQILCNFRQTYEKMLIKWDIHKKIFWMIYFCNCLSIPDTKI